MSNSGNSLVLGYSHASKLMADPSFYQSMPEFGMLKGQYDQHRAPAPAGRGCGGCRQKRVAGNLMGQFVTIMASLGPDRKHKLKTLLGSQRVLYYGFNAGRGTFEVKEL